jgi:hypothetical protein
VPAGVGGLSFALRLAGPFHVSGGYPMTDPAPSDLPGPSAAVPDLPRPSAAVPDLPRPSAAAIFRTEAMRGRMDRPRRIVAAWTGPRHRAGAVQTGPWWMTGTYWILLALLAVGLVAGLSIKVGSQSLIAALVTGLTSGAANG